MSNNTTQANNKRFGFFDYLKITILGFGLTAFLRPMESLILPRRLLDFVSESLKASYLGYLSATGLLLAMVTQPIVGAMSDRSSYRWGRRRPYILVGIILLFIFLPGIGLWANYAAIFVTWCLIQISSNTAQGPYQGFIPDLVPENRRGLASGVNTGVSILGGFVLLAVVGYFVDQYSASANGVWLWVALGVPGAVLLVTMLTTIITVKERAGAGSPRLPLLPSLYKSFKVDISQNRNFVWVLVSRGLMSVPQAALLTFAFYYIMDVFGIPEQEVGGVTSNLLIVVGISLIITAYFAGRLSDRIGRKPVLVSSGLLGALGILFLFLSETQVHLTLSGVVIGVASGAFFSVNWALAIDLSPKGEEAKYLGIANLAFTAGSGFAQFAIGWMIDFFNVYVPNLGYQAMLIICAVCFIGGSALSLKIK